MADEQDLFERDIILNEVQKVLSLVDTDELQFKSRSTDLVALQRKFSKLQTKIEKALIKTKDFNKEEQLKIRSDFNDSYYEIQTHVTRLKRDDDESRRVNRSMMNSSLKSIPPPSNNSKLPTLPLPSFSGESTDWPSYHDLFISLVHTNSGYTDAEKFRYLLLTLNDEPFNLIKSIPITDDNYHVALQILISRYQNKRAIATKHLERILDIESCSDEGSLSLRQLLNTYQENIKALEVMKFPTAQWDFVLLSILLRKISSSTRKRFELSLLKPNVIPSIDMLINFLERELAASEISGGQFDSSQKEHAAHGVPAGFSGAVPMPQPSPRRSFVANITPGLRANNSEPSFDKAKCCIMCKGSHLLTECSQFLNLSPNDRNLFISKKNVCFNCLSVGHGVRQCRSSFTCRYCSKRHHSLIHFPKQQSRPAFREKEGTGAESSSMETEDSVAPTAGEAQISMANSTRGFVSSAPLTNTQTVLLSTALVDVYVDTQKRETLRCLIDSGSQASFITEDCAQRLGLARSKVDVPVLGIGNEKPVYPQGVVGLMVAPTKQCRTMIPVNALILPKLIAQMPSVQLPRTEWEHSQNLVLADPTFHTPNPVEMLLGADVLSQVILGGVIAGEPGSPTAMNTIFGYVLFGNISMNSTDATPVHSCFSSYQGAFESICEKKKKSGS